MIRFAAMASVLALGVSACSTLPGQEPDAGTPPEAMCGATQMNYLIGQQVSEVDLDTLARTVRTIYPGQPVTRDYRPDRLNLDLDEEGVILRPWCG